MAIGRRRARGIPACKGGKSAIAVFKQLVARDRRNNARTWLRRIQNTGCRTAVQVGLKWVDAPRLRLDDIDSSRELLRHMDYVSYPNYHLKQLRGSAKCGTPQK